MIDETTCKLLYGKCLQSCILSYYLLYIAVYDKRFNFSQESIASFYHLPLVTYCGYYGNVHA